VKFVRGESNKCWKIPRVNLLGLVCRPRICPPPFLAKRFRKPKTNPGIAPIRCRLRGRYQAH
jgi:hypothetical protein